MIITNERDVEKVSTFGGKKIKYTVSPEAMGPIMSILSRQYSDTSLAPIREYTTNALDAQVEAGWERPVEITSPTIMNPIFKVQDFGIGMNAQTIEEVYSFYGTSTKSKSNDFNGSMGIGSKSAFAYTNQFTVVGIKGGVRTTVIISRDVEGGGDLEIVSEVPTDEHNGTTVSFTVNNTSYFNDRIKTFAKALAPGLLLVDGQDLSDWHTYKKIVGTVRDKSGKVVINGIYHTSKMTYSYETPKDTIYMGGIAYPALKPLTQVRPTDRHNLMVDVPLGTVKFTPSREALEDVPSTQAVHTMIEKVYVENLVNAVLSDIKDAKNIIEAYSSYRGNANILGDTNVSYKGTPLSNLRTRADVRHFEWTFVPSTGRYARTAHSSPSFWMDSIAYNNYLFVEGFPIDTAARVATAYKKKVAHWLDNNFVKPSWWRDDSETSVIFIDEVPDVATQHPLMSLSPAVSFDTIKDIRLPRKPSSGGGSRGTLAGKFHMFTDNGYELLPVSDLTGKDVYYVVGAQFKRKLIESNNSQMYGDVDITFRTIMVRHQRHLGSQAVIVNLYASRKDKFLRELGKPAVEISNYSQIANQWGAAKLKELTPTIARAAAYRNATSTNSVKVLRRVFQQYSAAKVLDPKISALLVDDVQHYDTYSEFHGLPMEYREKANKMIEDAGKSIVRERLAVEACYPLLSVLYYNNINSATDAKNVADYINAIYTNNNDGGKNAV